MANTGTSRPNPLTASYPSVSLLLHYPLFATNVRILCEKDGWKGVRGSSSLVATIQALRLTFQTEGFEGLYRGGHLYILHAGLREALRFLADRCMRLVEPRLFSAKRRPAEETPATRNDLIAEEGSRQSYWFKMCIKYLIDVACYPVLLASTRGIILADDPNNTWQRVCYWCREEGPLTLFNGLVSSLMSTGLDEAMDNILSVCIERCSAGTELEIADKLLLKTSGSSVVSVFTAPINHVGVIQRCQSALPGLLEFSPIRQTLANLPWKGSFYQLIMFSGILILNVKLIGWKQLVQAEDDELYSRSDPE